MILIEGNIGAGKTTMGNAIAASGVLSFVEEPTAEWREGFASNMLELLYQDNRRWAFTFQVCTLICRAQAWREVTALANHSTVVLERSIFTDRHVFAENCRRTGMFSTSEYQLYCRLWDFVSHCPSLPDVILYVRTPAATCLQRIRVRGRREETGIGLEYLRRLESLHDEWLLDHPNVVVLDGERQWTTSELLAVLSARVPYVSA